MRDAVQLGLGVLELGKPWGFAPGTVPSEAEALALLEYALDLGIRYFDSAPSYGVAEQRLGKSLRSLDARTRSQLVVATKFGEHWNAETGELRVDHSFDALARSLDYSLETLQAIDVLQLHKTTPEVLKSHGLERAWELARSRGIRTLGASVSDPESAELACGCYQMMQLPFNRENTRFAAAISQATKAGKWLAVNRPFGMGKLAAGTGHDERVAAFRFILEQPFRGVILTGTKSKAHLQQNLLAFNEARELYTAGTSPG